VSAHLIAGARRSARTPGKSDPIDPLAVAGVASRQVKSWRTTPQTRGSQAAFSYVWCREGLVFFSFLIDVFSR
jgi:hypothetical protein